MLITGFPAQAFGTNCYVVAPSAGEECVVVDPGIGVLDRLDEVLRQHRLKPAAVLLTHGHVDHVYSVTPVCGASGVPALIHGDDRYRLEDPLALLAPDLIELFAAQFGRPATWKEPDDVRTFSDHERLQVAGLDVSVRHAPGHTEGSVLFGLDGVPADLATGPSADQAELPTSTVLSGDVLFAGSIGRTDLPGGSHEAMMRSLRDVVLPLPDDVLVLPGHGPATTIGRERATNPYLLQVAG